MEPQLSDLTVEQLRKFADDNDISWKDENGKPLRKAELIDALELWQEGQQIAAEQAGDTYRPPSFVPPPETAESTEDVPATKARVPEAEYVQNYRVTETSRFGANGLVMTLPKGTVVNEKTHNLQELIAQEIPLVPCEPPKLAVNDYGQVTFPHGRDYKNFEKAESLTPLVGSKGGLPIIVDENGRKHVGPPMNDPQPPPLMAKVDE